MSRALVMLVVVLLALFEGGCLFSGGVGVTAAVTKQEFAVGPTLDVTSQAYTDRAPVRIPNSEVAAGPRLELGGLFPVARFDARESKTPALVIAAGANVAPTTLSIVSAGFSYRVSPWATGEIPSRAGAFLGGGGAQGFGTANSLRSNVLPAVFVDVRLTAPLFERGHGFGWELAATAGVRGYGRWGESVNP
ncbi:MAG: hypothetical protein KF764_22145 [Labilithrix sp.]|nr:hypothetical protein [Labilithrix sp.]